MRLLLALFCCAASACALPDDYDYDVDMDVRFRKESTIDCGWDPDRPLACESLGERVPCTSLGFEGGTYAECGFTRHGCSYTTELCEGVICGDGVTEGSEECDYSVPDELFVACGVERPAPVSRLACARDCTLTEESCDWCGDGIVSRWDSSINYDRYSEDCDPADTRVPPVCDDFYRYLGDEVVGCSSGCEFDFDACRLSRCGDGYFDDRSEVCERGTPSAEVQCDSLPGYRGTGMAVCQSNCFYDVSDCSPSDCGDGIVQSPAESCDPLAYRSQWCGGLPVPEFVGCTDDCTLDGAVCGEVWCGDGIVQPAEECDPAADRASWLCANGIAGDLTRCVDCETVGCAVADSSDAGNDGGEQDAGGSGDVVDASSDAGGEAGSDASNGCAASPSPAPAGALLASLTLLWLRRRCSSAALPNTEARDA